jgi:hypothetical protein
MIQPTLAYLRRVFGPALSDGAAREIKSGRRSRVYRVALTHDGAPTIPDTVIVKVITGPWPDDPPGPGRELRLYRDHLPALAMRLPRFYHGEVMPETHTCVVVLEDLAPAYRFPGPRYVWTPGEATALLRAYARLHAAGHAALPPPGRRQWLRRPWHVGLEVNTLRRDVAALVGAAIWQPVPGIDTLIERTVAAIPNLSGQHPTLLHNDLYPPNVALPIRPGDPAIILDWEMTSWGEAEMDLAYFFLQPYRSARRMPREEALATYWEARCMQTGSVPPARERERRQHHADAVMALALVPVARRVAQQPYPEGSAPRAYWDAMFNVLEERLHDLASRTRRFDHLPAVNRSHRRETRVTERRP